MASIMLKLGLPLGRRSAHVVRLVPASVLNEQRAGITHKSLREPKTVKPFPYETKKFRAWDFFFDDTRKRLDENSRIIVVEGNKCSGKTTLAKHIAQEFDFLHFPEVNMDMSFIDRHGWDVRSIADKFPEMLRPFDEKSFYEKPDSKLVPNFRYELFLIQLEQYCDALAHILNTGQGIVLERSIFSDFVYMDSLLKCGYISKDDHDVHAEMFQNIATILKPHLFIYLDAPVDVLKKRIMARNIPHEVNSKIRWDDYLKWIEVSYKTAFIDRVNEECEIMFYDWSDFGDLDVVIEDIERIDFEKYLDDPHDQKFYYWKGNSRRLWAELRGSVTMKKHRIVDHARFTIRYNHPLLLASPEDIEAYDEAFKKYYPTEDPDFSPKNGFFTNLFKLEAETKTYREDISNATRTR